MIALDELVAHSFIWADIDNNEWEEICCFTRSQNQLTD